MKSTIKEPEKKKPVYPYMGMAADTDQIVLFTAPNTGTVIRRSAVFWGLGFYSDTWNECYFTPFEGQIVLENS